MNTPMGERAAVVFLGGCNVGKSSLINAVTAEDVAIVSDVRGTTTDPVKKTMELLPFGPVVLIDTPGLDDDSELGSLRIKKSFEYIRQADLILLVVDAEVGVQEADKELLRYIRQAGKSCLTVGNKADKVSQTASDDISIYVSALYNTDIDKLKGLMAEKLNEGRMERSILGSMVKQKDFVLLVTPVDKSAPKGRLILPQQQVIRELLDRHAVAVTVQAEELKDTLAGLGDSISLVICDSQVFPQVEKIIPKDMPLTSFSILFANYKGSLKKLYNGTKALLKLKGGEKILISEGCTHHRQCDDIGTVRLPEWIREFVRKNNTENGKKYKDIEFHFTGGGTFPDDLSEYSLIVHCGGCMLTSGQMQSRMRLAVEQEIPITNYGMAIACMNGILERATGILPQNFQD